MHKEAYKSFFFGCATKNGGNKLTQCYTFTRGDKNEIGDQNCRVA